MSEKVWVTWKYNSNDFLVAKINNLERSADIDDLRTAFVNQQNLQISSGGVSVYEGAEGKALGEDEALEHYFVRNGKEKPGPGQSRGTALMMTLPRQQEGGQNEITSVLARIQKKLAQQEDEITSILARLKNKLDDMGTVDVAMSAVSMNFTKSLFSDLKITFDDLKVNEDEGEGEMQTYKWDDNVDEKDGQPHCQKILQEQLNSVCASHGIYDVRNRSLPRLQAGKRKSNGFSDMAVGPKPSMDYAMDGNKDLLLDYAVALVELKTSRAEIKKGQLLLQLISLSLISQLEQGVVVLGTDCAKQWHLLHFSNYNHVIYQPYLHGKKCMADFVKLIAENETRKKQNIAPVTLLETAESIDSEMQPPPKKRQASLNEDEQNLDGFELGNDEKQKAVENEAILNRLANHLGDLYGERPVVPDWARAATACPDYYM